MDRLKICMDSLRLLARQSQSDVNCVPLAELRIKEFLQAESATPRSSLGRLCVAIEREAEPFRGSNHFWIVVQEFVRSRESRGD
jgi:hypothetical protein